MLLTQIRNSFRLRRKPIVATTRPFPKDYAPTRELERAPELPAISARMVRCEGQRKRALRYEDYYAALQ